MFSVEKDLITLQQKYQSLDLSVSSAIHQNYISEAIIPFFLILFTFAVLYFSRHWFLGDNRENSPHKREDALPDSMKYLTISAPLIIAIGMLFDIFFYKFYEFNYIVNLLSKENTLEVQDLYFISNAIGLNLKGAISIGLIRESLTMLLFTLLLGTYSCLYILYSTGTKLPKSLTKIDFKILEKLSKNESIVLMFLITLAFFTFILSIKSLFTYLFFEDSYVIEYINQHYFCK